MTPILISAVLFILLEGAHHYSPILAFGIAIGMLFTSVMVLLAGGVSGKT